MANQFKDALRNTMKQVRAKLSDPYRTTSSNQICSRIRSLEHYRKAKKIALYSAVHGEVDLTSLWHSAIAQGKSCYFPALNEDLTLSFLPVTSTTVFKKTKYSIPEPDVDPHLAIPLDELDIIIMPIVAFDVRCTRLGMGSGFYDRTLDQKKNTHCFGVAYQFQRVDFIEAKWWDIPLDAVITQKAVYWRSTF